MNKLRLAYFGSPDFSASFLKGLLKENEMPIEIAKVITQSDQPVGRAQTLTPTPVKKIGLELGLKVLDRAPNTDDLKEIDMALLFAYGELIPKSVLDTPKYGFWNIHPSLLPLYRGPAPVANALIDCAVYTGVTLMKMDEKLDHGPIIAQKRLSIGQTQRCPELTQRLSDEGLLLFKKAIADFVEHNYQIPMRKQDDNDATYTKLLTKEDGYIQLPNLKSQISDSPERLFNRFRGLYPWPGIWTRIHIKGKEQRLKITDMTLDEESLKIRKVQLEGKQEVDYHTFSKAYSIDLE